MTPFDRVLSSPQERAWYDKNRERFISMQSNSEDELYELINNVVYQGFGDDKDVWDTARGVVMVTDIGYRYAGILCRARLRIRCDHRARE